MSSYFPRALILAVGLGLCGLAAPSLVGSTPPNPPPSRSTQTPGAGTERKATMSNPATGDQGPHPFTVDIEKATVANTKYRATLWTGKNLQLTVMSIDPGQDIGLERHAEHDQFLRIEAGKARVQMGPSKENLSFVREIEDDWSVLVPAGSWHNVTNIGDKPLKLYSIYAPPEHPHGTVHATKAAAQSGAH
jgi:mannose-6-phosphate isomerase-like protein (cupin superfamily)